MDRAATPDFELVAAPARWSRVDFISDLHLHQGEPATVAALARHLAGTPADAVFILGDLFEAWPGDDAADAPGFAADCAGLLRDASRRLDLFFLHGNRDFLVGEALAARCGLRLLADPAVLDFAGHRVLLSHGDALCLGDADYLAFRAQVRDAAWIRAFLARPLAEREAIARQLREASLARHASGEPYADVDAALAREWLRAAHAPVLVHGHTHRPADHDLGDGLSRRVLSDWDAAATPPRLQALRLSADGAFERIALA